MTWTTFTSYPHLPLLTFVLISCVVAVATETPLARRLIMDLAEDLCLFPDCSRLHSKTRHKRVSCQPALESKLKELYREVNSNVSSYLLDRINTTADDVPSGVTPGPVSFFTLRQPDVVESSDLVSCGYYYKGLRLHEGGYPYAVRLAFCTNDQCRGRAVYLCQTRSVRVTVLKPSSCSAQGTQLYNRTTIDIPVSCACCDGQEACTTTTTPPSLPQEAFVHR